MLPGYVTVTCASSVNACRCATEFVRDADACTHGLQTAHACTCCFCVQEVQMSRYVLLISALNAGATKF